MNFYDKIAKGYEELYKEEQLKLGNKWTYMLFALKVRNIAKQVHSFIEGEVKKGKTVTKTLSGI